MHHSRVNPPGQVERTGLVVALVLATAPALRKGLRMHRGPLIHRTGISTEASWQQWSWRQPVCC